MCKIKDRKCAVLLRNKIQHNYAITLIDEPCNGGSLICTKHTQTSSLCNANCHKMAKLFDIFLISTFISKLSPLDKTTQVPKDAKTIHKTINQHEMS